MTDQAAEARRPYDPRQRALELAASSPLRQGGRSAGCVAVTASGKVIESRTDPEFPGEDPTDPEVRRHAVHAEDVVVTRAAGHGISLAGATVIVSWFPCARCASLLVRSGVGRVICLNEFPAPPGEYDFDRARQVLEAVELQLEWPT